MDRQGKIETMPKNTHMEALILHLAITDTQFVQDRHNELYLMILNGFHHVRCQNVEQDTAFTVFRDAILQG